MEFREIETDVTPGISKTSLWAIIVILLIVIGFETAYIFTLPGRAATTDSQEQLEQQSVTGNALGFSNTNHPNEIITQTPERIPTLMPNNTAQTNNFPSQKITLAKNYFFPIKNELREELGSFQFVVHNYEFTNKVVVNNFYNATVGDTKKILAINIEINNDTDKAFKIVVRDYIRLSVDQGNWVAPEIHSDPVELRPQSSKTTVIGFPLNRSDNNLRIQIGEVEGEKELVDIISN